MVGNRNGTTGTLKKAKMVVSLRRSLTLLLITGLLCTACGDVNDYAQDISVSTAQQYILTQDSHPDGWGLTDCLVCHPIFKIHLKTSDPDLDLEKIQEVVDRLGQNSCQYCHGTNGT